MIPFSNSREAKECVISRIVKESLRVGSSLSESERKLLYFSEDPEELDGSPEDFDDPSDQEAYEKKIVRLIRRADHEARRDGGEEYESWWAAISLLKGLNDYIGVMIGRAGLRSRGDLLKLVATGTAISGILLVSIFVLVAYNIDLPRREAVGFYLWATFICFAVGYGLLRLILGKERFENLLSWFYDKVFPIPKR